MGHEWECFEPNMKYEKLQQTHSKFIFHGIFKRHKLNGGRVGSCFCIHQCFQERAFPICKVYMTKLKKQEEN